MKKYIYILLYIGILTSCAGNDVMVSLGVDDVYVIDRMRTLYLHPEYEGDGYVWTMKGSDGQDSVINTERDLYFLQLSPGDYSLRLQIPSATDPVDHHFRVVVREEEVAYSPYTAKVYEYRPAPGQFINTMPFYDEGDTEEDMRQKAEDDLTNDVMISLGNYGGYVTFAFDHTVVNVKGEKDFYIKGNAFYSDIPQYKEEKGGSAEPGIVMVAFDRNQNGIPDDDEWYELAGSEYYKPTTMHNYSISYQRPAPDHVPVRDMTGTITDKEYIGWTDNKAETGFVEKNMYHTQDYYPKWIADDQMSFTGTLLPHNGVDKSGMGSYYVLYSFDWGYVDNHPNDLKDLSSFDIGWAVDASGNPVHLPGVDFIRVYTGVNQTCGWLGETSTELSRAQDLHVADPNAVPEDPINDK